METNHACAESKFVKEKDKSFCIHFPRFIIWVLPGLVLHVTHLVHFYVRRKRTESQQTRPLAFC
jgi:hypothetical protein